MSQRVKLEPIAALIALTVELVRLLNAIAIQQKHLYNLCAIVLRGKHDGCYVRCKLGIVGAWCLPEGVGGSVQEFLVIEYLVLGVVEDQVGYLGVAHVDC